VRHLIAVCLLCLAIPGISVAEIATAELATPPASAQQFSILSSAGKHGTSARWTTADGTRMGRESLLLRGQVYEFDSAAQLGADGMLARLTIRGHTPQGDAGEVFAIDDGVAAWTSPVDAGSAPYHTPMAYVPFGGPFAVNAELFEVLLATSNRPLALLPGGWVRAERLTSAAVGDGDASKQVVAYAVTGIDNSPVPIWADAAGRFFAFVGPLSWLPVGYEQSREVLQKAQDDALARRSRDVARELPTTPAAPVAFTNVRAFVQGRRFVEGQTVLVDRGLIAAIGPTDSIPLPQHAQVVDGAGKTLVPGLWDSHQHVSDDASGPMLLSLGITSVRDPGNVNGLTLARAQRRAHGELLSPHVYPSVLIDGNGPNAAQAASIANSLDDALAIVRKAKAEGFIAIKFYGTFDPAWVGATAAEAHRLGLHVHGHLPAGMRPTDAIADGYDEITHIYFVIMQAMPASVVSKSNGIARMEGPARYAKDVDLGADPMRSLIGTMAQRQIVVDPTLVVAESLMVPNNGDLSPAYAPFVGTLPPTVERGFRQGGLVVPADLTRADYRASFAKLQVLVGALHSAGVPIVAGTDGSGLELVRELELYVGAGFTPSEALASATIVPARLVGAAERTGSIEVGKAADLVLVDGNPEADIGELRHTELVVMDGRLMDADALRAAGGIAGRPAAANRQAH
jgi:imidazolonepropionase-like amidohydrolase